MVDDNLDSTYMLRDDVLWVPEADAPPLGFGIRTVQDDGSIFAYPSASDESGLPPGSKFCGNGIHRGLSPYLRAEHAHHRR